MKILLLAFYFPPFNTIGAVRSGKTAKYLRALGHEVRVLTAGPQPLPPTLPLEVPPELVTVTGWYDVNGWVEAFRPRAVTANSGGGAAATGAPGPLKALLRTYKHLTNVPDAHIGWLPYARQAGAALMQTWRPDLIYASATPFTALLVARDLARSFGVPWVAEYRDLWTGNSYSGGSGLRHRWEARLEREVVGSACGLVTVSAPLADSLTAMFEAPVAVIMNGFDPVDYPPGPLPPPAPDAPLRLVYTGTTYPGIRSPGPLFEALQRLGPAGRRLRLEFYGHGLGAYAEDAARAGVADRVEVHAPVPYQASLRLQAEADGLLLLLWNDPREKGVYSGKLFEYLGAGRPILALGWEEGVAAELLRERGAGEVANDPGAIARLLERWLREKDAHGRPVAPPAAARRGFSREEQTRRLAAFLEHLLATERQVA